MNHHPSIFNKFSHIPESIFKAVPGVVKSARAKMPELPVKERITSFVETDLVLQEDERQIAVCHVAEFVIIRM